MVCYQLHHEARTLKGREVAPSGKLSLEWDLPREQEFTSTLSQRPARFWELEVKADTPGVDSADVVQGWDVLAGSALVVSGVALVVTSRTVLELPLGSMAASGTSDTSTRRL